MIFIKLFTSTMSEMNLQMFFPPTKIESKKEDKKEEPIQVKEIPKIEPKFKYVMAHYEFSYSSVWKIPVDWDEDKIGVRWDKVEYEELSEDEEDKFVKQIYSCVDFQPDFKRPKRIIIGDKKIMLDEGYETCEGSEDEEE